jgi:hypothetical protein
MSCGKIRLVCDSLSQTVTQAKLVQPAGACMCSTDTRLPNRMQLRPMAYGCAVWPGPGLANIMLLLAVFAYICYHLPLQLSVHAGLGHQSGLRS